MPAANLLQWYQQMGVEEATSYTSRNYISESLAQEKPMQDKSLQPIDPVKSSTHEIIAKATYLANNCQTLEELEQIVKNFDGCILKKTANHTVFADGNSKSRIMLIGEAPGANEDLQGIPFCGESGKLLDNMLLAIGLSRSENVYITNCIFWRPPGNRRPTAEEIAMCRPFVEKHIALIQPKLIVLVGSTAVSSVLSNNEPISKLRHKFYEYTNQCLTHKIHITPIFHPSYLLRQPTQKRQAWYDLLQIKEFMTEHQVSAYQ
jgi:DNA polymerase